VVVRNNGFLRGYAVPRGSVVETSPWTYARRVDLSAHDLARRIADARDVGHEVRPLEGPHARLRRDLTAAVDRTAAVVERTAVAGDRVAVPRTDRETAPRRVRTRPTPGDTVPELRSDPMTTIPFPVARRRPRDDQEPAAAEPNDAAQARTPTRWRRTESAIAAAPVVAPPAAAHPTDVRTPSRASEGTQPIRRAEPRPAGEGDRQVLRPLFRALAHPRSDEAERPQPRAEDGARTRPHAEPRAEDGERARPHAQPRAEDSERPRRPEAEGERGGAARPRAEGERAERSGRREGPPPAAAQPSSDGGRAHAGHRRKEGSE